MMTFYRYTVPSYHIISSHSHTVSGDGTTSKTKGGRPEEGASNCTTSTGIAIDLHEIENLLLFFIKAYFLFNLYCFFKYLGWGALPTSLSTTSQTLQNKASGSQFTAQTFAPSPGSGNVTAGSYRVLPRPHLGYLSV
jgi:hypothetical protein